MSEVPPGNSSEGQPEGQPSGQPGGYYSPGDYPRGPAPSSGRGTLILVLGILSLIVCPIIGPVAWLMGNNALSDIRAGRLDPAEQGLVTAGKVCGMVSSILMLLFCCFYAAVLAFGLGIAGLSAR